MSGTVTSWGSLTSTVNPQWVYGAGVPTLVMPNGSIYSRTDGTLGARIYVTSGGGTWLAIAGV